MMLLLFSGKRCVINNVMTTHVLTLWREQVMSFFVEIKCTLKAIKSHFERSYDKQNITLVAHLINFI